MRLQKAIAQAGICSRRKAEELIRAGEVAVNGNIVTEMGTQVDPDSDQIRVEGRLIPTVQSVRFLYAVYKPKSVVCTLSDPEGRPTIKDFFPKSKGKLRLFPVGRLDYDAEGLVLVTNDGELANNLMHPSKHVWKEYLVKLKGKIPEKLLKDMEQGPIIEGKRRQPIKARLLHHKNEKSWVSVKLQEGIKHHIKKMFLAVDYPVIKIKRISVGNISLEDMQPGENRMISDSDTKQLLELAGA